MEVFGSHVGGSLSRWHSAAVTLTILLHSNIGLIIDVYNVISISGLCFCDADAMVLIRLSFL